MTQAALCNMSSGISSVAHNNPHINVIFVYLFMRKLLVDKIPFLKFLYISHQPRLHQLNFTTSSRSSTVQASLTAWISSFDRGNTIKEGEIPSVENKYLTNISSTLTFLIHSLTCISQIFVPNLPKWSKPSASKLRYSEYFKKYEPC